MGGRYAEDDSLASKCVRARNHRRRRGRRQGSETRTPGVFDDRNFDAGEVKHVAVVEGEGEQTVSTLHSFLLVVIKTGAPAGATLVVDPCRSEYASANRNPEPWHAEPILPTSR